MTRNKILFLTETFILLRKSDFRKAGHILYVALDTFPCVDFLTDFHIDEQRKIKEDERQQDLAKGRSVIVEIFSVFVIRYTKTRLTTQSDIFS